jgi:general secretion pathway protein K
MSDFRRRHISGSQRGVALLLVLWVLTALMGIVFTFSVLVRNDLASALSFRNDLAKRLLAQAGLERATMEIQYRLLNRGQAIILEGKETWKTDGTSYREKLGEGYYTVRITDDSGKINLNALTDASGILLKNLLLQLAVSGEDADVIVDSILDWKDTDNLVRLHGAEDEYYMALPKPYKAKNANFETLEELLLVRGVAPDIFHGTEKHKGLVHFLTIHGNAQRINIASAPREVLAALPNMTPERAEQIIERRNTDAILKLEDFRDIFGGDYPQVSPYIGMDESGIFSIESAGFLEEGKPGYAIQATAVADKPTRLRYLYYRSPAGWTP